MAALECLRDIELDRECEQLATKGDSMMHTRWCHSMAGEEYARIYSWGTDSRQKGDYDAASPCNPVDLQQTLLEPVLVRYATGNGSKCRWITCSVSFEEDETESILTILRDSISGATYQVRSRFPFRCRWSPKSDCRTDRLPIHRSAGRRFSPQCACRC